jgi:hypothetical protein
MYIHPINIETEFDLEIDYATVNFKGRTLMVDAKAHVICGYVDYDYPEWEFEWVTINYITDEAGNDIVLSVNEEAELTDIIKCRTNQFDDYVMSEIEDRL